MTVVKDQTPDTSERIRRAAASLFRTRGFNGTSMHDLAAAVGITKSSVYHHFPRKQALLAVILELTIGRFLPTVPEERREESRRLMRRVAGGETLLGIPARRRRKDGSDADVTIWAAPVRDASGRIDGIMSVIEDVTERRRAETALRESEERYFALFRNSNAVMLLIDPATGQIVDANDAACRFHGYARDALLRLNVADLDTRQRGEVVERRRHMVRPFGEMRHDRVRPGRPERRDILRMQGGAIVRVMVEQEHGGLVWLGCLNGYCITGEKGAGFGFPPCKFLSRNEAWPSQPRMISMLSTGRSSPSSSRTTLRRSG